MRAVLVSRDGDRLVLEVPHTDYRVHVVLAEGAALTTPVGKRVRGTIRGQALRLHPSKGGGQFIEPVEGEPRIISGMLSSADAKAGRVLIDAVIPMWLDTEEGQDFGVLEPGGLVNCYVSSGLTFTPLA